VAVLGETETPETVDDGETVPVAVPLFVPSCVLVAVIVAVCEADGSPAGAVHSPDELIVPSVAVQVTVEA
jgi:hypothetical protein